MSDTLGESALSNPRPLTADIDVFGVTDRGVTRASNADHFFIGSFHRSLRVHATSLPVEQIGPTETESRGFLMVVADGVGNLDAEGTGSARALQAVAQHLLHATEVCSDLALLKEQEAADRLKQAVLEAHHALVEAAERDATDRRATTLTMYAAFWPRAFILHVGDSRCYRLRGAEFQRLTTDQTMAEVMVEAGAMSRKAADASHLKHVLWSAVGASEIEPEVVHTDCDLRDVILLCSDGLTKHVSDEEIRDAMARRPGAERTCRELLALALERGGTDNITIVVGCVRTEA